MAIRYTNQGSKRNEPLSPQLSSKLKQVLGPMGITFVVNSGGQSDTSRGRVGGHRHDHGNAGDGYFEMGGRKLTWKNPEDLKIIQTAITKLVAAGVQGIGAGDDYMGGNGHMHIGLGSPAVWGGSLKSDSAPSWLVQAHSAGLQGGGQEPVQQPDYGYSANATNFDDIFSSPYKDSVTEIGGEPAGDFGYTTIGSGDLGQNIGQFSAEELFSGNALANEVFGSGGLEEIFPTTSGSKVESLVTKANESTLGKSLVGNNPLTIGLSDIFKSL